MRRSLAARAALVISALLVVAGCGGGSGAESADPKHPVTIDVAVLAATEFYVLPWLVGQKEGFFADHGVVVKNIVAGSGGSATLRTQLSGGIPIGEIGYKSVLDASSQGIPVLAVGGGAQGPYGGDFYARADNTRVNELRDIKKWAYTNPGSSVYALSFLLPKAAGLPTKAERIAAGGVGEGEALLEAGTVDVAWLPPSLASRSEDKFKLVVSTSKYITDFQQSVITTSPAYAKKHPDVVRGVLAGWQQAAKWITQNPDAAARIYAEHVDLPVPAAVSVVQGAIKSNVWNVGFNPAALKRATEAAVVSGFKGDVKYCDFLDSSYLPSGATAELPAKCGA
ncbi:NitT/TauT family transport system substrate-binding protein [Streptomyces sp. SAI-135]|jgi:NitT/TauT family transport system substrate-binding protein|uniref:ABC transporter substrate-binding protein n=1 Tax=unclassified Streptomyces TaxID=2593676 RepID=UPI002476AF98|nr:MULTISPECIES: ABC transporter substrate-binding protein [unclassified Streptomyces]MDH6522888.1 NitT/TauT family transport system substrate-binding protein [Streptomyces sp. SAI-090]MDH6554509.1 NitT/TauT family transport system substrate-binding protein [Streptomyces sp. SAI-041]MDH6573775.1 NitT/TauT family transport system substrate-binding protein [Streptomyces sp. SAI-117]MDH6581494.1 NitT/TauT family transport system substrate-binding protein [Streptomyces sp. SAI-133]MDH6613498.1 Nit